MLQHHVHKRSHDLNRISIRKWLNLGFPWMWNTDILEVLDILTRLGFRDARMTEAVDLVMSKRAADGRWTLEDDFAGRMQVNVERKGRPSKWVTLAALRVLRRFCR
jgi:hypothetical protein